MMLGSPRGRNYELMISMRQLMTVFKLCDPENTGRVKVEYIQNLAKSYVGDDSEVCKTIQRV